MRTRWILSVAALSAVAACSSEPEFDFASLDADTGSTDTGSADTGSADTADATDEPDAVEEVVDEPDVADEPDTGPQQTSLIRFVHLSPDTPPVSLWFDGVAPEPGSPFSDIQRFERAPADPEVYVTLPTAIYDVAVVPEGGTLDDAIQSSRWALSPGGIYTVWIAGMSGLGGAVPEGYEPLTLGTAVDDPSTLPEDGQRIRFIHAATGVGPMDFSINGEKVDEGLQFGWFSFDEFELLPGEFVFGFGGTGGELGQRTLSFGNVTANVFVAGRADDDALVVYSLDSTGLWARVP